MAPGLRPGDTCMNSDINTGNDSAGHRVPGVTCIFN